MSSSQALKFPCGDCQDFLAAACRGHVECMEFAHQQKLPWDPIATHEAAFYGNIDTLKFAKENGYEWHPRTTLFAAINGKIDFLKFIYEECGDIVTWEISLLDTFFAWYHEPVVNRYLETVQEDWKSGLNVAANVKPARQ